jgi:hypothetical protein
MIEMFDAPIARSFLTASEGEDEIRPLPLILPLYFNPLAPGQEQQRILIISSPTWVRETIHDLHARGFANVRDWSSLLPGANPGEVVSILTRRRQRR